MQAQSQMRELLATFIERLAQMDESSGSYSEQMERCAERISQATELKEITPLLEEVGGHARGGLEQPPDPRRTAGLARTRRNHAPGDGSAAPGARSRQHPGAPRPAHRLAQPQGL
jgi:hypothetical protein